MAQKYIFKHKGFNSEPIESSLKQFSEKQIDEIFDLYRNKKSITAIREAFPEITKQAAFDQQIPLIISDEKCELCNEAVYHKYSRKAQTKKLYLDWKICGSCSHNPDLSNCECEDCTFYRSEVIRYKKEAFSDVYNKHLKENYSDKIQLDEIQEETQIKLYHIVKRYLNKWNLIDFNAYESNLMYSDCTLYAPWPITESIINELLVKKLLIPSTENDYTIATFIDGEVYLPNLATFDFVECTRELNIYLNDELMSPLSFTQHMENKYPTQSLNTTDLKPAQYEI